LIAGRSARPLENFANIKFAASNSLDNALRGGLYK